MIAAFMAMAVLQNQIGPPPEALHLDSFYKKCLAVRGLPIVSSSLVSDKGLIEAAAIVDVMLSKRPEMANAMSKLKLRIAVMAP
ncbi:MAG: hypothetical protein H7Y17_17560, partial [Chlorobia bacterium]|nr:hypothetical protein [Fimbriimonadaceae bacterium]